MELIPLIETTRGGTRESVFFGAVAVVDAGGRVVARDVAAAGAPRRPSGRWSPSQLAAPATCAAGCSLDEPATSSASTPCSAPMGQLLLRQAHQLWCRPRGFRRCSADLPSGHEAGGGRGAHRTQCWRALWAASPSLRRQPAPWAAAACSRRQRLPRCWQPLQQPAWATHLRTGRHLISLGAWRARGWQVRWAARLRRRGDGLVRGLRQWNANADNRRGCAAPWSAASWPTRRREQPALDACRSRRCRAPGD